MYCYLTSGQHAHGVDEAKGACSSFEKTVQEITARKQAQEERDLFMSLSHDILCIANSDGSFKRMNPALPKILGFTPEEMLSRSFVDFVHFKDRAATGAALQRIVEGRETVEFENRYLCRDGSYRWIEWRATSMNETGHIYAVARDVTDRKLAEEENKKLREQLGQIQHMQAIETLVRGVAHDFNSLLAAILGNTELAQMYLAEGSRAKGPLGEVLGACQRGQELVQKILASDRKEKTERRPIQLQGIVQETLRLLSATLPTSIEIRQHSTLQSELILADSTQMYQVIMNLCKNAGQAMLKTGGVLDVNVDEVEEIPCSLTTRSGLPSGPSIRLTVQDTGRGMSPEILDRIFEPFFTTKEKGEGIGIGLSVVREITTLHGGNIQVESVMGKGTTFQIYLPKFQGSPEMHVPLEDPIPQSSPEIQWQLEDPTPNDSQVIHWQPKICWQQEDPTPKVRECILLVDNEPTLCRVGKAFLEHLGYEVVSHTNSLEALEVFRQAPDRFDLVVTGNSMPNMEERKFVENLLQIKASIPIVFCTGLIPELSDPQFKSMGIQAILVKPIRLHELGEAIRQVLDTSPSLVS